MTETEIKKAIKELKKDSALVKAGIPFQVNLPESKVSTFAYLIKAIIYQQLSTGAANTIYNRFRQSFGKSHPTAQQILSLNKDQLRVFGISAQKAGYIHNICEFSLHHNLSDRYFQSLSDEEAIDFLIQIKGVGRWTAEMLLMFHLRRPDVFPVDDLGIKQATLRLFPTSATGKELKHHLEKKSLRWKPYRTIVCLMLWQWKDQ